jgi:dTDP-4-amino-4,6-dideoxygalactose transaminase
MNLISWPRFDQDEIDAVAAVLASGKVNYWTGEEGRLFEKEFASFAETEYAVAVSNGTVALDLALIALEIGSGDEVVVTSRTFLASASSIVTVGAKPVFADVDRDSQNITAKSIQAVLSSRTKAIMCVHLAGWPCDMDSIMALAEMHNLFVIEDCAQAHGARYKGRSVGSIGHVGAWSFCQDKIMTTGGEGGMVTTNDRKLWLKMWAFKDHGKSWSAVYDHPGQPGFRWLHDSFGTNMRMTEMQAAIGRIQLQKLPQWRLDRTRNAKEVLKTARKLSGLRVSTPPEDIEHAWYKCYLFIEPTALRPGWDRDRIMHEIAKFGVPCFSGSCSEVYLEKAFDLTGYRPIERLPIAKELGATSMMFLVHPTLTKAELNVTAKALHEVMNRAKV